MKNKLFFAAAIALLSTGTIKSQSLFVPGGFTTSGIGTSTVSGNVGIGTSSPSDKLTVYNGNIFTRRDDSGDAMLGSVHATKSGAGYARCFLGIYNGSTGHPYMEYRIMDNTSGTGLASWSTGICHTDNNKFYISYGTTAATPSYGSHYLTIATNGNVGIGKTDPGNYKLNVNGSIRANEIVVNTTGADFVFEPAYQLMSLQELETYLKANRHLPGIASAAEMQENGVSAGEMQTKLLQKVEELTLYVIELKKENEELKTDKDQQMKFLIQLYQEVQELKSIVK